MVLIMSLKLVAVSAAALQNMVLIMSLKLVAVSAAALLTGVVIYVVCFWLWV